MSEWRQSVPRALLDLLDPAKHTMQWNRYSNRSPIVVEIVTIQLATRRLCAPHRVFAPLTAAEVHAVQQQAR